tara:strand:+ start:46578 stop:46778 length:201 start_codon:yes stop_codon:yes gene_type:complete
MRAFKLILGINNMLMTVLMGIISLQQECGSIQISNPDFWKYGLVITLIGTVATAVIITESQGLDLQ